jgi:hypothetical protein
MRAIEQAGFTLRQEVPEKVRSAASGLLESHVLFAYSKQGMEGPPVWLLDTDRLGRGQVVAAARRRTESS